jgi:hypothetical protein
MIRFCPSLKPSFPISSRRTRYAGAIRGLLRTRRERLATATPPSSVMKSRRSSKGRTSLTARHKTAPQIRRRDQPGMLSASLTTATCTPTLRRVAYCFTSSPGPRLRLSISWSIITGNLASRGYWEAKDGEALGAIRVGGSIFSKRGIKLTPERSVHIRRGQLIQRSLYWPSTLKSRF